VCVLRQRRAGKISSIKPYFLRLFGGEEEIALDILFDLVEGFSGFLGSYRVSAFS
jgi:hypothetical protein